jgi:ribosomal protein S18 acetylase RimI-like enzyme
MTIEKTESIVRLHQMEAGVAEQIKALHDSAYVAEARLLGLDEFPPLKRTLESYAKAISACYGYFREGRCVGSVELAVEESLVCEVSSLVVDPKFLRQGIATKLMTHILSKAGSRRVIVSTASANYPAISLYEGLGFQKVDQWTTDDGVDIVQLANVSGNTRVENSR